MKTYSFILGYWIVTIGKRHALYWHDYQAQRLIRRYNKSKA
jgi:hypothetical protein